MTWRELLTAGKLNEAKQTFFSGDEELVLSNHFWQDLDALHRYLRAKHWQRAYNVVEDFEVEEAADGLVDGAALMTEIEVLKEASTLLDRRRPEEALTLLESVTQPLLLAEKMCQQGTAHIFLAETEQAKTFFVGGLELDPKHYRILTNLGNIHLEAKEIDNAIQYYEKALAIKDDFGNALHNLGVAYRQKGQISKSVGLIKKAQGNIRKAEAEDAKGRLSSQLSGPIGSKGGKYLKYGLYALATVIVLFLLRSRGIL